MPQSQTQPEAPAINIALDAPVIDIAKFSATALTMAPYEYIIVPGFIRPEAFEPIVNDYPVISKPGSFPLGALTYGPAFAQLLGELESDAFRAAVEAKFGIDLTGRPTMITVRGMCDAKDGKIHTDTESKILSLLLYMNPAWEKDGGRLRLLNSKHINDVAAEVPPVAGTLLIFRRADNSFHGHTSYAGPRKVVQLNWVTEQKFADRNIARHRWSSFLKRLNPFKGEY
jgi:hypothetical protein